MSQSESTKKLYEQQLKRYSDLNLNEPDEVFEKLQQIKTSKGKPLSLSFIKGVICAIIWKLRVQDPDSIILKDYRYIISNLRGKLDKQERDHNKVSGLLPSWDDIIKKREEEFKWGRMKNHLILSLYTYIAPRRIKDYVLLRVVKTIKQADDSNLNYYVTSEKNFVFNNYKTSKTLHQQIIKVPDVLDAIIMNYVVENHIIIGGSLLSFKSYLQMNYLLKKLVGCGIDNIRHSYVNNEYKIFNIPKNEFMEKMANDMGHSLETNLRYRKF